MWLLDKCCGEMTKGEEFVFLIVVILIIMPPALFAAWRMDRSLRRRLDQWATDNKFNLVGSKQRRLRPLRFFRASVFHVWGIDSSGVWRQGLVILREAGIFRKRRWVETEWQ